MTLTVHGHPLSPFVRKVLFTLEAKGIEHVSKPVFPGDPSPEFRAMSPFGRVPVLQDGDFSILDSSVICRYLDRVHPGTPIYPADPKLEARACWVEEYADTTLITACAGLFQQRFLFPKMMGRPTDEAVVAKILAEDMPTALAYVESIAPERGYFVGDALSIADFSVVTCFLQARYADFSVDATRYPKLAAYLAGAFANSLVTTRTAREQAALAG
jgi:glutathione S-transferase